MRRSLFSPRTPPPELEFFEPTTDKANQFREGHVEDALRGKPTSVTVRRQIMRCVAQTCDCQSEDEVREFCKWNPEVRNPMPTIPGFDMTVDRIATAIKSGQRIVIFGDFDCDGVTSVTLMMDGLKACGAYPENLAWFVPNRFEHGYGVTRDALETCLTQHQPDLLIVVDCGSNSRREFELLNAGAFDGIKPAVIIIDHHSVEPSSEPHPALAHLNPKAHQIAHADRGLNNLCAAGLVFLFWDAASPRFTPSTWKRERALILAGVATYADVVPLTHINRTIVKNAIKLCNSEALTLVPGLRALHRRLHRRMRRRPRIDEGTFGFKWGPCLNANGRLDEAMASVELLSVEWTEEEYRIQARRAIKLAHECVVMNTRRVAIQLRILEEAVRQAEAQVKDLSPAKIILAAAPWWNLGVVGIVAGRLREKYNRPAIVCGMDATGNWRGSGRSVPNYDLGAMFHTAKDKRYITSGGGHPMAGGLSFTERQRPFLHQWLNDQCELEERDFRPRCEVLARAEDLEIEDWRKLLGGLAPFGQANPYRPLILRAARLESVLGHNFGNEQPPKPTRPKTQSNSENRVPLPAVQPTNGRQTADSKTDSGESDGIETGRKSDPPLATGRFWINVKAFGHQPELLPQKICATWKNIDRVRREWIVGRYYTLELDVARSWTAEPSTSSWVVLNSWQED